VAIRHAAAYPFACFFTDSAVRRADAFRVNRSPITSTLLVCAGVRFATTHLKSLSITSDQKIGLGSEPPSTLGLVRPCQSGSAW